MVQIFAKDFILDVQVNDLTGRFGLGQSGFNALHPKAQERKVGKAAVRKPVGKLGQLAVILE